VQDGNVRGHGLAVDRATRGVEPRRLLIHAAGEFGDWAEVGNQLLVGRRQARCPATEGREAHPGPTMSVGGQQARLSPFRRPHMSELTDIAEHESGH
jgi:hypothetical protein